MSPCRNGSNEPVSLWMSLREKQDMSTGERSTWKQEEHSFLPRGVVLASILCSPLHWFDSQCWSPKTQLRLMNERQLHIVLRQICLQEYNLTWLLYFPSLEFVQDILFFLTESWEITQQNVAQQSVIIRPEITATGLSLKQRQNLHSLFFLSCFLKIYYSMHDKKKCKPRKLCKIHS